MADTIASLLLVPLEVLRRTLTGSPGVGALIGAALAPAVLISASALMLLGLQNKYTAVSGRVRDLGRERRALPPEGRDTRLRSIETQTNYFLTRLRLMRGAIATLYAALLLFVLTSMTMTLGMLFRVEHALVAMLLFIAGIAMMTVAVVNELLEVRLAFKALVEDVGS